MLNEITHGGEAFKVDVSPDFAFVPLKVTILCKEGNMIRYKHQNGQEWLWHTNQFFHNQADCLAECDFLNTFLKERQCD